MQVHTLDMSFSAAEATDWVAPQLEDSGIEGVAIAFTPECILLSGRATRPFPMPFRITLAPRVEGTFLWLDLTSVQAAGPLGSWLQGPLLALAASRLADFGVRQEGKSLGIELATAVAPYLREVVVDHLDVGLGTDRLRIKTKGSFALGS